YLSILYGLIFLVCFPGNILTIFVYLVKMRPWKSSTIIMFNLAVTDLLYVATLPFFIHYSSNGNNWVFGAFMCKFIHFCFYFNMYSGIIFLSCFGVLRWLLVAHPARCWLVQNQRWAVLACAGVWVISLVAISPLGILITPRLVQNRTICPDLAAAEDLEASRRYNWLLTGLAFGLPTLLVTLCYVLIICSLAAGPHSQACYKQKARRLAAVLLVVFYLCFLPFHLLRGLQLELRARRGGCRLRNATRVMLIVAKPLAAFNTFGNLLLYVVMGDNFQQAILSL
ncbi:OXGR1 protein, partial [Alcedo cyanopectus]|nr:OXGR1 protein [Ceyx cyanopectus]